MLVEKDKMRLSNETIEITRNEIVNALCDDEILPEYKTKLKSAYDELSILRKEALDEN